MLPIISRLYARRDEWRAKAAATEQLANAQKAMGEVFGQQWHYEASEAQSRHQAEEYARNAERMDQLAFDIDDADGIEKLELIAEAAQQLVGFDKRSELCDWLEDNSGLSDTEADEASYHWFQENYHERPG